MRESEAQQPSPEVERGAVARLARNSLWSILGWVGATSLSFFVAPVQIRLLGSEQYGLMLLLASLTAPMAVLDLGMSEATIKYVSESLGAGQVRQAERYLQSTFAFNILVGIVGALAIGGAAHVLVTSVFNIERSSIPVAQQCLLWTALIWLLRQVWQTYVGAITACQRYSVVNIGNLLSQALNAVAGIVVLVRGGDLLAFTIAQAASTVVQTVGWMMAASRVFPEARFVPRIDRGSLRKTVSFGVWQMLNVVSGIVAGQSQRWILGILLPIATVGYYSVALQLNTIAYIVAFRIGQVMFPAVSQLEGTGEQRTAADLTLRVAWLVSAVAISGLVAIVAFVPDILGLWITPEFAANASGVCQILGISTAIGIAFAVPNFFLLGTGRARWLALVGIGQGLVNFVAAAVLIPRLGVGGAGWASVASMLFHVLALGLLWSDVLKPWVPLRVYLSALSPAPMGLALGFAAVSVRASWPPVVSWWALVACTSTCAVVSLVVLLTMGRWLPGGSQRWELVVQLRSLVARRAFS